MEIFPPDGFEVETKKLASKYPFLAADHTKRLVRDYGTEAYALLGDASSLEDLGRKFGADLFEREVVWLMDREWAKSADDVLWRRSKLRLRFSKEEEAALESWIAARLNLNLHSAAE